MSAGDGAPMTKYFLAAALAILVALLVKGELMTKVIWAGVVFAVVLAGCEFANPNFYKSDIDVQQRKDGTRVLQDTPRMWEEWRRSVDKEVLREVSYRNGSAQNDVLLGKPNGGGTWDQYWLSRVRAVRSPGDGYSHEHPQKYIDYIIEQRRKAGLPELVGYP
ncbi:MAG: hypothetical protein QM741_18185 [Rudaea sp.]|uniref:hypothetical protein n=1 Tax=Rudaea sp. TaxID=2136325 RepID=UPI0039E57FA0